MSKVQKTITISASDVSTSSRDIARYTMFHTPVTAMATLVLVLSLVFVAIGVTSESWTAVIAAFGLIVVTACLPLLIRRQAKRSMQAISPVGSKLQTTVDAEGLWTKSSLADQRVSWSAFRQVSIEGSTIIFRQRGGAVALMLPARAMTPEALRITLASITK